MANGTTFHNFASREAQQAVDWSQVSKDINTALTEKAKAIELEKATVNKNSSEFITTLNESTQSENRSVKDWAMDGANNIQEQALILKRMLENGKLKKRDYTAQMQALTDGGAQLGQLVASYNEEWQAKLDRGEIDPATGLPSAQDAEGWFMEQMEGFSNFKTSGIFVNPLNSKVTIGKRTLQDPTKPFNAQTNPYTANLSQNPSDYATLPALLSRSKVKYNMFDANTAVTNQVGTLGKIVKSIQANKVETWENALDDDEYEAQEKTWIESTRAGGNILNVSSVLTNSIGQYVDANGNRKDYGFTQDVNEAKNDPSLILFSQEDVPMPIFDQTGTAGEDQIKAYDEFMQTMMRGKLNDIETARAKSRAPTSQETKSGNEKKFAQSKIPYMRALYNSNDESKLKSALSNLSKMSGGKNRYEIGSITDDALEINFITYTEDKSKPGTFTKKEHPQVFSRTGSEDDFVRGIASTMSEYGGIDALLDNAGLGTTAGQQGKVGAGKTIRWGSGPQVAKDWDNIGKAYKGIQYKTAKDYFEDKNVNSVQEAKDRTDNAFDHLASYRHDKIKTAKKTVNGVDVLGLTYPGGGMTLTFEDTDASRQDLNRLIKAIYHAVDKDQDVKKEDIENAITGTTYLIAP